ncbi:MAG: PHP domain-containing protein [Anaerolineae bacterium]|nr:PHP domain-containing protein [Anaerolineae bacterium]
MNSEIVIKGAVGTERTLTYMLLPFQVPEHVGRIDVAYEYDAAISSSPEIIGGNVVDIGIFDPHGAAFMGEGFRGWSGSEQYDFFITTEQASSGYIAGPIQAGEWNVILGFYKVAEQGCHYQVTIKLQAAAESDAQVKTFRPRLPLRTTAMRQAHANGWYKGELHCHSLHSDGDSSVEAIVRAAGQLGLDFLAVTDHNNYSQQMDLNTVSTDLMLIPGYEVTTYQGHWNIWGDGRWIDFRITSEQEMVAAIQAAQAAGYLISCNHPRPYGPDWMYPAVEGYDCVEVWNGPWEFMNDSCLDFWETRLKQGKRLVAVGGSDCHHLRATRGVQFAHPTTFIHCEGEPSAAALLRELRAGHAFISCAPDGPQVRLTSGTAMMGDSIPRPDSRRVSIQIEALDAGDDVIEVCTAQGVAKSIPTAGDTLWTVDVEVGDSPYVRVQVRNRENKIAALTNPIYLDD